MRTSRRAPRRAPQIVALGGGGFSMEKDSSLLDDYILSLTGAARPRVCFLPTASGDADHYVVRFYRRFSAHCDASHVSLFRRDQGVGGVEDDLATHLLAQDLIYVGGGNVVSMLGAWRAHGLDSVLRRAWRRGIVLCGPSAGSLCWFEQALSAFHGAPRGVRDEPAAVEAPGLCSAVSIGLPEHRGGIGDQERGVVDPGRRDNLGGALRRARRRHRRRGAWRVQRAAGEQPNESRGK